MENGPALVDPGPDADHEPELLQAGPRPIHRRTLPILAGLVALVVAGLLTWQLWPRPVPPLTLAELEGIYAGMVRGDGSNDASVLPRPRDRSTPAITPSQCQPMFDPVELDRFPADAIDAMGTYWTGNLDSGSLFSFRFADADTAERAFSDVAAALQACDGKEAAWGSPRQTAQIRRTEVSTASGISDQLGFVYVKAANNRFAVHVLRQLNLVSWQFRYAGTGDDYSPFSAQQRMDSLVAQTSAVIDLRR